MQVSCQSGLGAMINGYAAGNIGMDATAMRLLESGRVFDGHACRKGAIGWGRKIVGVVANLLGLVEHLP
jgi:hypothetical protein